MKTFEQFINEAKITVYHGGNVEIINIDNNYHFMYHKEANVQEGVGIYFTPDVDVAKQYGKIISTIKIDSTKFLPSRETVSVLLSKTQVINLLKEIAKNYDELWMMATDYGFEVNSNKELVKHYDAFAKMIMNNEIRNFQIELVQNTNIEVFAKAWQKVIPFNGTYNKELQFYAIIKN